MTLTSSALNICTLGTYIVTSKRRASLATFPWPILIFIAAKCTRKHATAIDSDDVVAGKGYIHFVADDASWKREREYVTVRVFS